MALFNMPDDCHHYSDLDQHYAMRGPQDMEKEMDSDEEYPATLVTGGHLHMDGGDSDNNGRWVGGAIGCRVCRQDSHLRVCITRNYLVVEYYCDNCGEDIILEDKL